MRTDDFLERLLEFGLMGLLVFTALIRVPLPITRAVIIFSCIFLIAVYWLRVSLTEVAISLKLPGAILIGLFLVLVVFQLLPLSPGGLRIISPRTLSLYRQAFYPPGSSSAVKTTISVYSHSTRLELLLLLAYAAIFYLTVNSFSDPKSRRRALQTIIIIGVIYSVWGPFTQPRGIWIGTSNPLALTLRRVVWFSPLRYQAHFVEYLEVAFFVALGYFLDSRESFSRGGRLNTRLTRRGAAVIFGIILAAIFISPFLSTYARSPWLVYPALLLIMAVLSRKAPVSLPARVVPAILFLLSLFGALAIWLVPLPLPPDQFDQTHFLDRVSRLQEKIIGDVSRPTGPVEGEENGPASGFKRMEIYRDTLGMIGRFPLFGVGLGNFKTVFPIYKTSYRYVRPLRPHNDYLELLAETGVFGFLPVAALLILFFRAVAGYLPRASIRFIGCAAGLGVLGLEAAFTFPFEEPSILVLAVFLAGLIIGETPSRAVKFRLVPRWKRVSATAVLLVTLWIWGNTVGSLSRAASHHARARIGPARPARRESREAVFLDPGNAVYRADLGERYREKMLSDPRGACAWGKEAARQFLEAVRLNPLEAALHYRRGRFCEEIGEDKTSGREFRKAVLLWPTHPTFLSKLASFYLKSGEQGLAVELYRKAVAINPHLLKRVLPELFRATHDYLALKRIIPPRGRYYLQLHQFFKDQGEEVFAGKIAESARRRFPDYWKTSGK